MRFSVTIVHPSSRNHSVTVDVDAPEDASLADLATALAPYQPVDGVLHLDDRPLDGRPIADALPLDGALVTVGAAGRPAPVVPRGPRVHVEAGPDSGVVAQLQPGPFTVGRERPNDLVLSDPELSRRHLSLEVTADGIVVSDQASTNGTYVGGRELVRPVVVPPGAVVAAGQTRLSIAVDAAERPDHSPAPDGSLLMARPFRSTPTMRATTVALPRQPGEGERPNPFPWIALVLPLVLGVGVAVVMGRPEYAAFALLGPVGVMGTTFAARRNQRRDREERRTTYEREVAVAQQRVAEAVEREALHRRRAAPSLAVVTEICCARTGRLWERRAGELDFLRLRVGTAALPATSISYEGEEGRRRAPPVVPDVPVTVDVADLGVVGVHGDAGRARALARALVLQAAALHGPDELRLVVIARDAAHRDWEWVRWLPHLRHESGPLAVGIDPDSTTDRLIEIAHLVEERRKAGSAQGSRPTTFLPVHLVLIEDVSALRANAAVPTLLTDGPGVGVHTICVEHSRTRLPQQCRAAIDVDGDEETGLSTVTFTSEDTVNDVALNLLHADLAERSARHLSPVRVADGGTPASAGFGGPVRLLDVLGCREATAAVVHARWRAGGRTTQCRVGRTAEGTFTIDLARDGPHGLVAGTTGAGKSQFLMSLVTSLAYENTPEDLNFVLVDFKGGGAFAACRDLPHTVGLVTNLAGGGARRAIRSLRAEALKRQALFAPYQGDIEAYEAARRRLPSPDRPKIARLLVVVDEFAQLASQHEDLLREFVDVAQIGRSLGMNMILATQRPAGVITGQIQANTDLRVALRLAEPADSMDVIGSPVAARLPKASPGRAYIRADDRLTEVQTAAVGLPRPDVHAPTAAFRVRLAPWVDLSRRAPAEPAPTSEVEPTDTDLFAAVSVMRSAAELGGYSIPEPPFRDELPVLLEAAALGPPAGDAGGVPAVPIGLEDLPLQQAQRPFTFHPADGSLLLPGSQRSGRTTALRTIAGQLAEHVPARDLHLYVLDFGGGLRPLEDLPHCGAVVSRNSAQRAHRLVARLEALARQRMEVFERLGVGDIVEQRHRHPESALPFVVLLVDRWDVAYEKRTGGMASVVDGVVRLLRDGQGVGIVAVVAGDARSCATLTREVGRSLCLRQNAATDFDHFQIRSRDVAQDIPDGRAYRSPGAPPTEVQLAVLGADASTAGQNRALGALTARAVRRDASLVEADGPFRVDELPARVSLDEALALAGGRADDDDRVLVGVGGDRLAAQWFSFRDHGRGFVVSGPDGAARTAALLAMGRELVRRGVDVAVLAPGKSALADLEAKVALVGPDAEAPPKEVLDELAAGGAVLLVDDADQVRDDSGLVAYLGRVARGGVVAAGSREWARSFRGLPPALARSRSGLLLTPQTTTDGAHLGVPLRQDDLFGEPACRGLLVRSGAGLVVQVPT